jgi:hypothetical protein
MTLCPCGQALGAALAWDDDSPIVSALRSGRAGVGKGRVAVSHYSNMSGISSGDDGSPTKQGRPPLVGSVGLSADVSMNSIAEAPPSGRRRRASFLQHFSSHNGTRNETPMSRRLDRRNSHDSGRATHSPTNVRLQNVGRDNVFCCDFV